MTPSPRANIAKTAEVTAAARDLESLATAIRVDTLALGMIDPISGTAPVGTQVRRVAAYNTLMDLAVIGRHRFCAKVAEPGMGPCVLRADHDHATYQPGVTHMDAEQRDRAIRYLVHSEPDPERRA
jgi:hypothetical protein